MLIEGLPPRSSQTCIQRGERVNQKCCSIEGTERVWRSCHRKTGTVTDFTPGPRNNYFRTSAPSNAPTSGAASSLTTPSEPGTKECGVNELSLQSFRVGPNSRHPLATTVILSGKLQSSRNGGCVCPLPKNVFRFHKPQYGIDAVEFEPSIKGWPVDTDHHRFVPPHPIVSQPKRASKR
jgi:hypothetical protein